MDKHRLFSTRQPKKSGNILEIVSYWDHTVLDVDLLAATPNKAAALGGMIAFRDSACSIRLLPDMKARSHKNGGFEITPERSTIDLEYDDVLHIQQGNLDFVLRFIQLPVVTLPKSTRRHVLEWSISIFMLGVFLASATAIYLTRVVSPNQIDDKPWLILDEPVKAEVYQRPVERIVETTLPRPKKAAPVPRAPIPRAPIPRAPIPRAPIPRAPTPAEAPKAAESTGEGHGLKKLGLAKALGSSASQPQVPDFRPSTREDRGGTAKPGNGVPGNGLSEGRSLVTQGSGDAAQSLGSGAKPGFANIDQGFDKGESGKGRALVTSTGLNPLSGSGLRPDEVQKIIRANLNQIRHCYEQLLQRNPGATGQIKMNFVIGGDGRVASTRAVSDTVGDAGLTSCISEKILRWTFPSPRDAQPVNVNYPFLFLPH